MTIDLTGLVRPHVVEMVRREDVPSAAEFRLQPLERGFGHTLGNALRRMLLSSLQGSAVWAFRLEGVVHEHQTVPGVAEDIHQIIQNLKSLTLVVAPETDGAVLKLSVGKAGTVTARDIEPNGSVTIIDPDHVLFTLQEDREMTGEFYVNKGRGYVEAAQHSTDRKLPVDLVRIDALYNPVIRANFTVAETRVGQRTDFDSLTLSVETNGAITPEDGVAYAAALLQVHLQHFIDFGEVPPAPSEEESSPDSDSAQLRDRLAKSIDDCGLSVRSINSLKNSNISTLGDLVKYSEDDMLKVKNVGDKALKEIAAMLAREGLSFGMDVEESPQDMVAAASPATPGVTGESDGAA
ncbi:MAG: DNA-directed RNA polymerase subunit alpha [Gemmatimonadales bacterium]